MTPSARKPVSPCTLALSPRQIRFASRLNWISRGSRPCVRHQPQFRLDCSAPMSPFSQSTTSIPLSASASAVLAPMIPPPITTAAARPGGRRSLSTESGRGVLETLDGVEYGLIICARRLLALRLETVPTPFVLPTSCPAAPRTALLLRQLHRCRLARPLDRE